MSVVCIPPKKPDVASDYARPALVPNPKQAACIAGSILSDLWAEGLAKTSLFVGKRKFVSHHSTQEQDPEIYTFRTDAGCQGGIVVFHDFSAIIYEEVGDDSVRVIAHPLRLNQRFRRQDEQKASAEIVRRSRSGTTSHQVRTLERPWEEAPLKPYSPGPIVDAHAAASGLHAQILQEARWWHANAPTPTKDCPPIGVAFHLFTSEQQELLREVAIMGFRAAVAAPEAGGEISTKDFFVLVHTPRPRWPDGDLTDFSVTAQDRHLGPMTKAKRIACDYVKRAIDSDARVFRENFLAQGTSRGKMTGNTILFLDNVENPSGHEAIEAYRQLSSMEADAQLKKQRSLAQ